MLDLVASAPIASRDHIGTYRQQFRAAVTVACEYTSMTQAHSEVMKLNHEQRQHKREIRGERAARGLRLPLAEPVRR